jgi:outer membrane protein
VNSAIERRATRWTLLLASSIWLPAPASGQSGEPLVLEHVVQATLIHNIDVQLAALAVESTGATLLAAAAPFDSALELQGLGSRTYVLSSPNEPRLTTTVARELSLGMLWSKLFRNGLLLAPEVTTTHTRVYSDPRLDYVRASARLTLTAPLLRDLGGRITRAPEESARAEHRASALDERQAAAQGVLQAAQAYWAYLAATRRLEVQISSEERARQTADDIAALVKADERTRADLAQAQGTLASRRANRIAAEQGAVLAWQEIAVLTGAPTSDFAALPRPTTSFPGAGSPLPDDLLPRWSAAALADRPDLAAARARLAGAGVQVEAARNELWPRLDLSVGTGYNAQKIGAGPDRLADPLYRNIPGADVSVRLALQLPLARAGARGELGERRAEQRRIQLTEQELQRRIRIGVAAAFEIVKRSRLALHQSEEAVTLLRMTVESEKRKFKLGLSTLFAVIQAEDSLTSALLTAIEGERALAAAMATLRFETGALLPATTRGDSVRAVTERLKALP